MIRLSKSVIGNEEILAVTEVLKKEFLGMGEEVKNFENELESFLNNSVVCVNTGTAALQLALQSIGIVAGDEVLVQSLTYVASFQAITATSAIPVPCEVNPETLTIDLVDAKSKLTSRTKAIMPVHYSGSPGNLDEIYKFAHENKLRVIEDAAHAFGSYYNDKLIGSFGDIICFSFDGIKNITSGEGGAIVTSDLNVLNKIKDIRLLGVTKDSDNRYQNKRTWDFDVLEQGWRYHMSNIMAAIGRTQLKKFPEFKRKRQELAIKYHELLSNNTRIKLLDINYNQIVPHIFVIRVKNRDKLKDILNELGIQTGIHYRPNHLLTYFRYENLLITEDIYSQILTLPLHPDLEIEDVYYICEKLIKNVE
jgi:dTDP-4-amino-4,6-dideoxygalactose transaminase